MANKKQSQNKKNKKKNVLCWKMQWKKYEIRLRNTTGFENLENGVIEAAIFVSKWRHNHLIKYAKNK